MGRARISTVDSAVKVEVDRHCWSGNPTIYYKVDGAWSERIRLSGPSQLVGVSDADKIDLLEALIERV